MFIWCLFKLNLSASSSMKHQKQIAGAPIRMPRSSFYFCIVLLMLLTMKGKYVIDKLLNFAYNMGAGDGYLTCPSLDGN